jgi:cobalt-zinc-cadmium efflux system outer membrane protein
MKRSKLFFSIFSFFFIITEVYSEELLKLDDVVGSVKTKFPLLIALEQEIQNAEGEKLSTLGEFDLKWKNKATFRPAGFYDFRRLESVLEKPTDLWGLNVYGGYRQGDGKFPVYYEDYKTTPSGEFHAGFSLPLIRDREIDQRRASLRSAELGVELTGNQVDLKKIEILFKASEKYWSWVAYGLREEVFKDLLKTAQERVSGLKDRVSHGDLARIELVDNERVVLQREAQVVKAERAFQNGSIELSLYYRDENGMPIITNFSNLPPKIIFPDKKYLDKESLIKQALDARPELKALKVERAQVEVDRKLADNQLEPKFDVFMEVSNDIGSGDKTKEATELESGVMLEIPLQRRKAEGKMVSTQAKLLKLDRQIEFISNRIKADIQDVLSALENARLQVEIIKKELQYAREVEQGERDKFKAGESTILLVNLREITTADTASKYIEVLAEYHVAEAMLEAVLANTIK